MSERMKTCKVTYKGEHLASVWYLPDGTWTLEQTDTHVPPELWSVAHLFQSFVGKAPPPLVRDRLPSPQRGDTQETLRRWGVTLDDPIACLVAYGGHSTDQIRFVR